MHDSTGTHREAGFRVDLILGCYSKASVTVSCCPGEINGGLQLLIHLLINGATKLRPVVPANKHSADAETPRRQAGAGQSCPRQTEGREAVKGLTCSQNKYQITGSLTGTERRPESGGSEQGRLFQPSPGTPNGSSVKYPGPTELEVCF